MSRKFIQNIILSISFIPNLTWAFPLDLSSFVCLLIDLINTTIPVLVGIGFVIFFYGVAKFILASGDAKAVSDGKLFMIYGVIGIFVLVSFYGIIQFMSDQFFSSKIQKPFLPGGNGISCDVIEPTVPDYETLELQFKN